MSLIISIGTRVRTKVDWSPDPSTTIPGGSTGTVVKISDTVIWVRLDKIINGLEEWDNQLGYSEDGAPADGPQAPLAHLLEDCDIIGTLADLAAATNAITEADDGAGSDEQVDAQNVFTEAVKAILGEDSKQWRAFEDWCLKATEQEIVDEGLRLVTALKKKAA